MEMDADNTGHKDKSGLRKTCLRYHHQALNLLRLLSAHFFLGIWLLWGSRLLDTAVFWTLSIFIIHVYLREVSEWVHEASHFNLVISRKWNDRLINFLGAPFYGVSISQYRKLHNAHHATETFFTPEDPDTQSMAAQSQEQLWRECGMDLFAIRAFKVYFRTTLGDSKNKKISERGWIFYLVSYHMILIIFSILLKLPGFYILYIFYLISLYPLFSRLRTYGQHAELTKSGEAVVFQTTNSRTIDAGILDRIFFTSGLMLYHYEHHLFPTLPFRALKKISKPQKDINFYSTSRWPIFKSLFSVRREN